MQTPQGLQIEHLQSGEATSRNQIGVRNISTFKNLFTRSFYNEEHSRIEKNLFNDLDGPDFTEASLREKLYQDLENRRIIANGYNTQPPKPVNPLYPAGASLQPPIQNKAGQTRPSSPTIINSTGSLGFSNHNARQRSPLPWRSKRSGPSGWQPAAAPSYATPMAHPRPQNIGIIPSASLNNTGFSSSSINNGVIAGNIYNGTTVQQLVVSSKLPCFERFEADP